MLGRITGKGGMKVVSRVVCAELMEHRAAQEYRCEQSGCTGYVVEDEGGKTGVAWALQFLRGNRR